MIRWIYNNKSKAREKWLKWYKEYFVPTISKTETGFGLFLDQCNDYAAEMVRTIKPSKTSIIINNVARKNGIKRIDVMKLDNIEGMEETSDQRTRDHTYTLFYRLPWRWRLHFTLRMLGWTVSKEPWVVERK